MEKLITITARKAYGRTDYLPENELAKAFCELLGKPVLPLDAIIKLRKMGYTVTETLEPTI